MDSDIQYDDEPQFVGSVKPTFNATSYIEEDDDDDFEPVFVKSESSNVICMPDPNANAANKDKKMAQKKESDYGSYRQNDSSKTESSKLKFIIIQTKLHFN